MGSEASTLKGMGRCEESSPPLPDQRARPLGAVAQRGMSDGVALATRRAAGRGSAGGEGPSGDFSRAGKAAALLPPAVFPLWRVPI